MDKNELSLFVHSFTWQTQYFYVVWNNIHRHHPKINQQNMHMPTSPLNDTGSQLLENLLNSGTGLRLLQNLMLLKTNRFYSRESSNYIKQLNIIITI